MHLFDSAYWSELQRHTLAHYDEALLRTVAVRLVKPRNQWPVEDLIERGTAILSNPAVIDRRLQELTPAARRLLALIGHSRQPCWNLGNLVELAIALGQTDGLQSVLELLEAGLLYPLIGNREQGTGTGNREQGTEITPLFLFLFPFHESRKIKSFEQWMAAPGPAGLLVFAPPQIAVRAIGEDLGLPDLIAEEQTPASARGSTVNPIREADGLEWLLRLAVLWQQVAGAPLRRTQQGGFFKRDLERLQQDALLNAPPADHLADVPDAAFLAIALAEQEGMVEDVEGELRAGALPAAWDKGVASALESLWARSAALVGVEPAGRLARRRSAARQPVPVGVPARLPAAGASAGRRLGAAGGGRSVDFRAASVLDERIAATLAAAAVAGDVPARRGVSVASGAGRRAARTRRWRVRLSPAGRWLLGLGEAPNLETVYTQTLLVQPNLQIIAYRQGLTSSLIARLTQFAAWENLGPACTLQLHPETVYRALEAGQTFESIRLTLEQHGTRGDAAGRARFAAHLGEQARSHHGLSVGDAAWSSAAPRTSTKRWRGPAGDPPCRHAGRGRQRGEHRVPPFPPDRHARLRAAAGEVCQRRAGRRDAVGGPGAFGSAAGDGGAALRGTGRRLDGQRPAAISADAGVAAGGSIDGDDAADAGDVVFAAAPASRCRRRRGC